MAWRETRVTGVSRHLGSPIPADRSTPASWILRFRRERQSLELSVDLTRYPANSTTQQSDKILMGDRTFEVSEVRRDCQSRVVRLLASGGLDNTEDG